MIPHVKYRIGGKEVTQEEFEQEEANYGYGEELEDPDEIPEPTESSEESFQIPFKKTLIPIILPPVDGKRKIAPIFENTIQQDNIEESIQNSPITPPSFDYDPSKGSITETKTPEESNETKDAIFISPNTSNKTKIKNKKNTMNLQQNNENEFDSSEKGPNFESENETYQTSETPNSNHPLEDIKNFDSLKGKISETATYYKGGLDKTEDLKIKKHKTEQVVIELSRQQCIKFPDAAVAIADIYQKGGHLKNVQNRSTIINGLTITKNNINQALLRLGYRDITHRDMARSIREEIHAISKARDIPGHLFAQYREHLITRNINLDPKDLSEHSYYCTDFHIDNPDTPNEVSRFLITRNRTKTPTPKSKK